MKRAPFANGAGRLWGPVVMAARHPPGPCCRSERGASSVLVVGVLGVILVLIVSTLALGSVVIASHRARSAADLGALAGATALRDGAPPR